jgi:hypothetical protein
MSYHAVTWNWAEHPARFAEPAPREQEWWLGRPIPATDEPPTFALQPLDATSPNQSEVIPYLFGRSCPLVTQAFAAAVVDFGVDHVQVVPVRLMDGKREIPGYVGLNVLGLVHAADLEASVYQEFAGGPVLDVAFSSLVLAPARTYGLPLFRLAEDPSHLWLHDALRAHLLAAGFDRLAWWKPSQIGSP